MCVPWHSYCCHLCLVLLFGRAFNAVLVCSTEKREPKKGIFDRVHIACSTPWEKRFALLPARPPAPFFRATRDFVVVTDEGGSVFVGCLRLVAASSSPGNSLAFVVRFVTVSALRQPPPNLQYPIATEQQHTGTRETEWYCCCWMHSTFRGSIYCS